MPHQSENAHVLHTLAIATLPSLMIIAAISDLNSLRIPNWLTALTAILFFPMALATGLPWVDFGWHVATGFGLFVLGYILFSLGLFGGGDAKLMAAAGLWFGPTAVMSFLFLTALFGGLLAIAFALWSLTMAILEIHGPSEESIWRRAFKKTNLKLPYGVALAIGAILAFPKTWWMTAL